VTISNTEQTPAADLPRCWSGQRRAPSATTAQGPDRESAGLRVHVGDRCIPLTGSMTREEAIARVEAYLHRDREEAARGALTAMLAIQRAMSF